MSRGVRLPFQPRQVRGCTQEKRRREAGEAVRLGEGACQFWLGEEAGEEEAEEEEELCGRKGQGDVRGEGEEAEQGAGGGEEPVEEEREGGGGGALVEAEGELVA